MMVYLKDDDDNILSSFDDFIRHPKGKPAEMPKGHKEALHLWKERDDLHFENEEGKWLDPFSLEEE